MQKLFKSKLALGFGRGAQNRSLQQSTVITKTVMSSTFSLTVGSKPVTVSLPPNLTKEQLQAFDPFKRWLSKLTQSLESQSSSDHPFHASPYELRSIEVQAVDWFGKKLGFIKMQMNVSNEKKEWLPGAVFLRGPSVAMLLLVTPDDAKDESEKYAVLTVQPRVAAGSLSFVEVPAGMLDEGSFAGRAASEIKEECDIEVLESDLTNMTELAAGGDGSSTGQGQSSTGAMEGMYPSPGACDEYMQLFLAEKTLPRAQIEELKGKLTGLRDEGEKITLKIVPLKDVWREASRDGKALACLALYHELRNAKMIK